MEFLGFLCMTFGLLALLAGIICTIGEAEPAYLVAAFIGLLLLLGGAKMFAGCNDCCPKCDAVIECAEQTHCSECGHLVRDKVDKKEDSCEHDININVSCNCDECTVGVDTNDKNVNINTEESSAPTTEANTELNDVKKFCSDCGKEYVKDAKYCSYCGNKIN
jgi:hypothetical protein